MFTVLPSYGVFTLQYCPVVRCVSGSALRGVFTVVPSVRCPSLQCYSVALTDTTLTGSSVHGVDRILHDAPHWILHDTRPGLQYMEWTGSYMTRTGSYTTQTGSSIHGVDRILHDAPHWILHDTDRVFSTWRGPDLTRHVLSLIHI